MLVFGFVDLMHYLGHGDLNVEIIIFRSVPVMVCLAEATEVLPVGCRLDTVVGVGRRQQK